MNADKKQLPAEERQEAIILDFKDVEPEPIKWLWPDRFQSDAVNTLVGNQEVGKSTLALYTAAKVVAGGFWPYLPEDAIETGSVIILSTEDNIAQIIKPKLVALAQDLKPLPGNRIVTIAGIREIRKGKEMKERGFNNLTTDWGVLVDAVNQVGNVRLIIIDPITDYAGGKKENSNAEVREYLGKLKLLAENMNLAIIGLSHLNKDAQKAAVHRTLGSVAWTALPRAAWLVEYDPEDAERRCLLKIKCNGAVKPLNAAFRLRSVPVVMRGKSYGYPVCDFEAEPISITAEEILNLDSRRRKQTKQDEAVEWLELFLGQGAKLTSEIIPAAAKAGHSRSTLYRAKDRIPKLKTVGIQNKGKVEDSKWLILG